MTATTHLPATVAAEPVPAGRAFDALAVVGGILLLLGVTLGPLVMFSTGSYADVSGTTAHLVHYAVWTACLLALSGRLIVGDFGCVFS